MPRRDTLPAKSARKKFGYIEPLEARIAPAPFIVTSHADSGAGSLRQAIEDANAAPGTDTIDFHRGFHGKIRLSEDLPAITDSVTISGPGAAKLKVDGHGDFALFSVIGADLNVSISGLKLTGGKAASGGGIFVNDPGGTVQLDKVVISGNQALGGDLAGNGGGAAVMAGTLILQKSKITGNKAGHTEDIDVGYNAPPRTRFIPDGQGGGIEIEAAGTVQMTGTVIGKNLAGDGGGIHNAGSLTLGEQSRLVKNLAQAARPDIAATGGGISNTGGTVTIQNSKVTGNSAIGAKGDDYAGPGGNAIGGGIFNASGGAVAISQSKISGNKAIGGQGGKGAPGEPGEPAYAAYGGGPARGGRGGAGGTGGTAGDASGGGVANDGMLTIESSKVTGNAAIGGKGGTGGHGGKGGQGSPGSPAQTYDGHHIPAVPPGPGGFGGAGGAGGDGGAGADGGIFDSTGAATISTTKVSGNAQLHGRDGAKGAVGAVGKRGSTGGGDPYFGGPPPPL